MIRTKYLTFDGWKAFLYPWFPKSSGLLRKYELVEIFSNRYPDNKMRILGFFITWKD